MENKFLEYLSFAHYLADRAGDILLNNYKSSTVVLSEKNIDNKKELVTDVDLMIEKETTKLIKKSYPEHNIIGEETGEYKFSSDYTWIIDPIDGTKAFAIGIPVFGFLLALKYKNNIILGLVDQPITGERFWNNKKNSFINNEEIKTSNCKELNKAKLASTDPNMFDNFDKINNLIFKKCSFMRWGTDVFGYLRCAEGKLDAVIERDIKLWDVAAIEPILRFSGGFLSTWDGKKIGSNDTVLASCNYTLHKLLLNQLQKLI